MKKTDLITIKNILRKEQLFSLTLIFLPAFIYIGILGLIANLNGIKFGFLSQDPIQLLNAKPYIGIISYTGIILWCSVTAILLFSAKTCRSAGSAPSNVAFLFWAGIFSLVLLIDDLFMFHDMIMPDYFNIDDKFFFASYLVSLLLLVYFHYKILLKSDYILLILAVMFFGASGFIDVFIRFGLNVPYSGVFEDGAKFMGIVAWFSYFTRVSDAMVTGLYEGKEAMDIRPKLKKKIKVKEILDLRPVEDKAPSKAKI
jgi:hypothetical protein